MLKFISHVHTIYSTDGWHNPDCVLKYAIKNDVYVELLAHNHWAWTKLYPRVFKSERIIAGIEFRFGGTDVIACGDNLGELAKDKRFQILKLKTKRRLNVSLEEGIEILRKNSVEYIYLPHPTFPIAGIPKKDYDYLIPKIDGIEVWNGLISLFPFYNMKALNLAEKFHKTKIAGIDGHLGDAPLKSCYNLVEANSKDEIYEAVRKNRLKPHINPLYPILSAQDYGVLAFLILRDFLNPSSNIKPSNFISLIKQLY
ncbi:MAG: hypothetical protein QMD36_01620 [Candidatus Aenigmarchaeota archaeon]|nr:hypothetical protein [Candidatus Aenigmarchaeota archaeon]